MLKGKLGNVLWSRMLHWGMLALMSGAMIAAWPALASSDAQASPTPAQGLAADAPVGWNKMGSDDGIDVFTKEIPGDPVVALRGEGLVNAPIARVASVILDDDRATEWVDSLVESKLIRMIGDREFVEYSHIGTPFVLKDRDFLTRGIVQVDLKEKTLTMTLKSTEDPAKPEGKYVRGVLQGYWKMRSMGDGRQTYVIAEMHADPKGSVPKWIVNLFQKGWAKGTIESLRKQVAKTDIKIIPEVTKIFGSIRISPAVFGVRA
jgi:hypothetical protein